MYKDITTYRQNDKKREVRVLENSSNGIRFTVHRHIDYGEEWLLSCVELGVSNQHLEVSDLNLAKEKGVITMAQLLGKKILNYEKAIRELSI